MDNITTFVEYWQGRHEPKARVLFIPDLKTRLDVQRIYTKDGTTSIGLGKLILEENWIPDPTEVFERINKAERESRSKSILVTGVYAYLTLIDEKVREHFVGLLGKWLADSHEGECAILLQKDEELVKMFEALDAYPRFLHGKQCMFFASVEGEENFYSQQVLRIVNKRWQHILPRQGMLLSEFLEQQEQFPSIEGGTPIVMDLQGRRLAIAHRDIEQLLDLRDVARVFYEIYDNELSEPALEWACLLLKEDKGKALFDVLNVRLLSGYDIHRDILRRYDELGKVEREWLLWLARRRAPEDSYLAYVLNSPNFDEEKFFQSYVTIFLDSVDHVDWAEERFHAIREAGIFKFRAELSQVIKMASDKTAEQIIPWFCGTKDEKIDHLRRCQKEYNIPGSLFRVYSELKAYLADYDYGDDALNNYFSRYRYAFVTNRLDREFVELSRQMTIPLFVESRDAVLQKYSSQEDCALLVVDAMGAEWLPMLLEQAKKIGIGIEWYGVCKSKIPTITEINSIFWPKTRRLSDVKQIDNIGHNGLEAHVVHSPEENIAELLEVVDQNIMIRVQDELRNYRRVIVTADHGCSRLAVLASQSDPPLARSIKIEELEAAESVRYCKKPSTGQCPSELQESVDGQYWVVKGYERISKKGGLGFAVHGGATLEEVLVPFVVFSCEASQNVAPRKVESSTTKAQIVEDPDFDL